MRIPDVSMPPSRRPSWDDEVLPARKCTVHLIYLEDQRRLLGCRLPLMSFAQLQYNNSLQYSNYLFSCMTSELLQRLAISLCGAAEPCNRPAVQIFSKFVQTVAGYWHTDCVTSIYRYSLRWKLCWLLTVTDHAVRIQIAVSRSSAWIAVVKPATLLLTWWV